MTAETNIPALWSLQGGPNVNWLPGRIEKVMKSIMTGPKGKENSKKSGFPVLNHLLHVFLLSFSWFSHCSPQAVAL